MSELNHNRQNEYIPPSGAEVRFDLHKASDHVSSLGQGQELAAARLAIEQSQQTAEKTPTDSEIIAVQSLYLLRTRRHLAGTQEPSITPADTKSDFGLAAG